MKFQFKPTDNILSFREYLLYLTKTSPVIVIYLKTVIAATSIFIFTILTYLLSSFYTLFLYSIPILLALLIITILLILLVIKIIKKKRLKNSNIRCDIESTFYFTLEDDYLIRENNFSYIKVELSKLKEIKLLNKGLVLSSNDDRISIFIPKDILPVTLDEFISLLKTKNSSLVVIEEFETLRKSLRKIWILLAITIILSIIFSFLIGKYNYEHNFTKYELIPNSELIKEDNKSYLYENEMLGISLNFPSKWENKFGIEEKPDRINVYYLVDGKQGHYTNLLFSVRSLGDVLNNIDLNIIRTDGLYIFVAPTSINLKEDSKEHLEYIDLYNDIKNIKLQKYNYNSI